MAGFFTDLVAEVRRAGGTDEDIYRLATPEGKPRLAELARLIVTKIANAKPVFPSQTLAVDLIPSGWTVVKDVAPTLESVGDLEFLSFLNEGEESINGEMMRQRAVVLKANLGLSDLKVALDDQTKIPAEMRPYYIVFPGTLLWDPDGHLCVACLDWGGGRWVVLFFRVAGVWGARGRLARCK